MLHMLHAEHLPVCAPRHSGIGTQACHDLPKTGLLDHSRIRSVRDIPTQECYTLHVLPTEGLLLHGLLDRLSLQEQ